MLNVAVTAKSSLKIMELHGLLSTLRLPVRFGGRARVIRNNPLLVAPVTLAFSAYNIGTFAVTNTARWRTCGRP
jgi:hypothetical protein